VYPSLPVRPMNRPEQRHCIHKACLRILSMLRFTYTLNAHADVDRDFCWKHPKAVPGLDWPKPRLTAQARKSLRCRLHGSKSRGYRLALLRIPQQLCRACADSLQAGQKAQAARALRPPSRNSQLENSIHSVTAAELLALTRKKGPCQGQPSGRPI